MQYVAYYRVSTQDQGRSGLGLDAQQQAVARHVKAKGGTLLDGFTEIESGKKADRPQLHRAMKLAVDEGAILLIAKLDRLARSVQFISTLLAKPKLELEACDMPAANKMTMHIMAAVAEGEALAISQRTKAALEQARLRGKKLGLSDPRRRGDASRYAKKAAVISKIGADNRARELGQMIAELKDRGLSFSEIAERFTALRMPQKRKSGGEEVTTWTRQRIHKIYQRYTFIGPMPYGLLSLPAPVETLKLEPVSWDARPRRRTPKSSAQAAI